MDEIQRFWQIEDITETSSLSVSDQNVIKFYEETTKRRSDGRYEVRLPMKQNFEEKLGSTKQKAFAQFHQLERKLNNNKNISEQYKLFMNEYKQLGHMTPADNNMKPDYHMPHHHVTREDSITSKLRVVFNASTPGLPSNLSLNDLMERGPNLQQDLQTLILKWRQYKYAFTADIEKMFRQIWVAEEDQRFQKVVWRDSADEPIKEYTLTTVTYGTRSAPYLAMMTLRHLASEEEYQRKYSAAAKVVKESLYMDDVLHGDHSLSSAKQLQSDLIELLKLGGFNLRKWSSNYQELLQGSHVTDSHQHAFDFRHEESMKTLGLRWHPKEDVFSFELKCDSKSTKTKPTKRSLLSEISKLFDPLGWLSPVTTKLKLIFQSVWAYDLQWDSQLPENIEKEWIKIQQTLIAINDIRLPRWLQTNGSDVIELHGFCDSSTKAYACVIYSVIRRAGQTYVSQVIGKARLVPIKKLEKEVSLPRLELCGAHLLSKVMSKVKDCFPSYQISVFGWTDSMVTLAWLQGEPGRWKSFVSTRVQQTIESIPPDCWRYVESKDNPADCASRGITPEQLQNHNLWWQGPSWLPTYQNRDAERTLYSTEEELKKIKQVNSVLKSENAITKILDHYSSFSKAVRATAWLARFIKYLSDKRADYQKYLTISELRYAKTIIIKHVQREEYQKEIQCLEAKREIKSKSKILSLRPQLDEEGIMRVGGRIKNAYINPEMKHPIIIPTKGKLTELLIRHGHEHTYHGGPKITSAFLRQKYWIVGGNREIKKQLRLCVTCRKHSPSKADQLMGDLPEHRINASRPFYHTRLDFTGHIMVKANKGRGIKTSKGYIAVFVCMVTKAVHLELVSDLSTSALLAAVRRMAGRRGTPRNLYSDNGTNFIGGNRVLQQEYEETLKSIDHHFISELSEMEIKWHFQAPSWPSAGGIWEAAVKQVKKHLTRVIGSHKLTYEEYATLLTQIEACLNGRPLCAISEDPEELDYLTPAHFLASGPILTIVETEHDLRTRWHLVQKIYQDVWKRWRAEYLSQLSIRPKWRSPQPNIKEGDIVIIQDANLPPGKWALGRVLETHPGKDGYVRVVSVKTKNGVLKRPIVKLSRLPVQSSNCSENVSSISSNQDLKQPTASIENNKRPQRTIRKKNINLLSLATSLLFFFSMLATSQCAYNFTKLPPNQMLYFDKLTNMQIIKDDWRLVVYYDLDPYWAGLETLNKQLKYLDSSCSAIRGQSHCEQIISQLQHGFSEIRYYNDVLLTQRPSVYDRRHRRGLINGIGNLANNLFGILDDKFASKYERDISLIRENENHLAKLWKNQTSVVEAEFNLMKRMESFINKQHKSINQRLSSFENTMNTMGKQINYSSLINDFTISSIIANNLLNQLKSVQTVLLDTITDIYNGKLSLHMLTPEQLRQELNIISAQIPRDLSIPTSEVQLPKLYHLLKVKSKISREYLIFEISIPLLSRNTYEIYQVLPIPKQSHKNMMKIIPISSYVAINLQKESMIPITAEDINTCLNQNEETILCHISKPTYHISNDDSLCEKNNQTSICNSVITDCRNSWIELHSINSYLYFCCNQCNIKVLCQDQAVALQLSQAGLFTLSGECTIRAKELTITSHYQRSNNLTMKADLSIPEIAPINNIINITLPVNANMTISEYHESELNLIKQKIDAMKEETPLLSDRATYHDIHQYTVVYSMLGVMAAAGGWFLWRRARRRGRSAEGAATATGGPKPEPAVLYSVKCGACEISNFGRDNLNFQCSESGYKVPIVSPRNKKFNRSM
ncbi:hypothetical protein JYU34_016216 [Plutella xylostella]|uniref:Integrase catalytic domain-containing protein n=1 Tax=Plutella xylostella TaxID=51655 RepID=A0ABQ7Q298_PLUXY|nr:hypothetical protein JYU34_016216 [Plutella xylostella]